MHSSPPGREQQVLAALIQLYIERREPVSSRMLEESGDLGIRSASIRNVLGELERRGLLYQPHTSSGRIPTDAGYRAYVDGLLATAPLLDGEEEQITIALREAGQDLRQLLQATAKVLSRFSRNITILAGPLERSPQIVGVDLYRRDSSKVLVVVSLDTGAVRTELVDLDRSVRPESLVVASTFLAERLGGFTLDETRRGLDALLREAVGEGAEMAADLARGAHRLFDPQGMLSLTFQGVSEALEQPEFADPARLKALLEMISSTEDMQRTLERCAAGQAGEVALTIGRENPLSVLHPFSLLATRFELSDQFGYLAILGPRRMRYARTLSLLRLIASHLEQLRL